MIQVRKVQPQDLDYIFKYWACLGLEKASMLSKLEHMMVVIDNNELCGIGAYVHINSKCMLDYVHIKESHRRNKLGTMLVKAMLSNAEQQGALQAYMYGECDTFAEYLGFHLIEAKDEIDSIKALYHEVYYSKVSKNLYKVSLYDYFKPCGTDKKCK